MSRALRARQGAVAMTISAQVRKMYPDCYFCAGIGWCGPEWREAEALESELRALKSEVAS